METINNLRSGFRRSSMLMKIIWINIGVFVLLRLGAIVCMLMDRSGLVEELLRYVELPSSLPLLLLRPWTAVTYMFAQYDLSHILFNMLWLYWFGALFLMISTPRQLLALYIEGGLAGGALFLLGYNLFPLFSHADGWLIGSSASVMAIVTATAIRMPDFKMQLLLIGSVKIKWIAIATILLVLLGVTGANAGGEIAHVGGILMGALYAVKMRQGRDLTAPLNRLLDRCVNSWTRLRSMRFASPKHPKPHRQTPPSYNPPSATQPGMTADDRRQLDEILDKIKRSGYSALTADERKRLFEVSSKIK